MILKWYIKYSSMMGLQNADWLFILYVLNIAQSITLDVLT